jgi:hypothetical protein
MHVSFFYTGTIASCNLKPHFENKKFIIKIYFPEVDIFLLSFRILGFHMNRERKTKLNTKRKYNFNNIVSSDFLLKLFFTKLCFRGLYTNPHQRSSFHLCTRFETAGSTLAVLDSIHKVTSVRFIDAKWGEIVSRMREL